MIDRRAPNDKLLAHDATLVQEAAGGPIDIGIVLGSGLSSSLRDRFAAKALPYDKLLGFPVASLRGHAGEALVGTWQGKRVCVFAGRVHLYQGFSPQQVTVNVRLAQAAGARMMILTNAAGGLNPDFEPGDLMMLSDHLNLTGRNPLVGLQTENPFVDMMDCYASRLRDLLRSAAKPEHRLREGVYAGLLGPNYETVAEGALSAGNRRRCRWHVDRFGNDRRAFPRHGRHRDLAHHQHRRRSRDFSRRSYRTSLGTRFPLRRTPRIFHRKTLVILSLSKDKRISTTLTYRSSS